jgi:DNA-binding beta-propeller fold protein YncE
MNEAKSKGRRFVLCGQVALQVSIVVQALLVTQRAQCAPADEPDLPAVRFVRAWGTKGSEPSELHFPIGIAITKTDEVLITDHYNNRVQKFDRDGKLLGHFAVLPNPGGIALDKDGNIYLGHFPRSVLNKDVYPDRVTVYSRDGKLLHEWGKTGTGPGEFEYPGGLAIAPDGRVYIADQTNHRMQVLDPDGRFLAAWGKHGTNPGEFAGNSNPKARAGPNFVALDSQGNVYTTEAMDGRVQKFRADGTFVLAFGDLEDRPGSFGRDFESFGNMHGPVGISCDREDRLWISAAGGRIQQFTNDGHYLRGFGEEQGDEPGQFLAPHGLALDSRGDLYVVDAYNHRVQKFAVGRP